MSFRKALIIGVNHYEEAKSLTGAVNDATEVSKLFYRNDDGSLNYGCLPILGTEKKPLKKLYFRQ